MRQPLSQVLGTWIQATLVAPAAEPLALDGKTVRGARSGEQTAPHLLAFCSHHSQETLWQGRVDEKTNAIPVAQAALLTLPIRHRVCTAAALHTQTDFMRVIHAHQAETVLTYTGYLVYLFYKSGLMMTTTPNLSSFSTSRARFSTPLFPCLFWNGYPK